eukprot:gb/GECH01003833.1/.p1 GENE.gb/GECH01003833.1/~~gb/GECH01003833.1/.p1  ORF type:complete len:277 (+),score=39.15 gb/GECH01003833.1/:1-831(+)
MNALKQSLLEYVPNTVLENQWLWSTVLSAFGAALPLYGFYYMFRNHNQHSQNQASTIEPTTLDSIKDRVEVGDLFVLVSNKRTPGILKFVSKSKMYLCALVIRSHQDSGDIRVLVAPPVSDGVIQTCSIDHLIQTENDIDDVYWLPLAPERRELLDILRLSKYAGSQQGKSYHQFLEDVAINESCRSGAPKSQIPFVCSSILIADALRVGQVLSRISPMAVTANDLVRWSIFADRYYQVHTSHQRRSKSPRPLPGFNTVAPEGFGMMTSMTPDREP